eukprot:scaffold23168_cov36-Phaeocystis_antarctica.AAC.1
MDALCSATLCNALCYAHAMHMHRGRVEEARQRHIDDDVQRILVDGEGPLGRVHLHGCMHTWCMCTCHACPTALKPCVRRARAVHTPCACLRGRAILLEEPPLALRQASQQLL